MSSHPLGFPLACRMSNPSQHYVKTDGSILFPFQRLQFNQVVLIIVRNPARHPIREAQSVLWPTGPKHPLRLRRPKFSLIQ